MSAVDAQIPGVFYRRPSPDADPYIEPGSAVEPGQTLGLIEVMKTYNEIKAETAGVITKVLLDDGDEVDVGQPLFELDEA
ncbi:acetyl-CoA carboxylase [Saccharopolyspora hirsuta]|uniref:Biotin carboxyl carrier protein of acetyl-CoA carboxylase n=1 Tax=Saccharopolyspora hirsuta TaxID=1837 RepID=A0A5M7BWF0_SACHI|nr:acetyl-CoA carboxylase [Saccharopolyspora hirsuta]KAA5830665.1 biotin carboxyl carrier domain-containing protein [Saccharopolyspora hirsuta]